MRKRTVRLCLRLRLPRRELLWSLSCCRVLGCERLLTSGLGRLRYSCPFWDSPGSNDRGLGCKWAWMECAGRLSKSKNARDEHGWRSRSVTRVNVTFACSRQTFASLPPMARFRCFSCKRSGFHSQRGLSVHRAKNARRDPVILPPKPVKVTVAAAALGKKTSERSWGHRDLPPSRVSVVQ